MLGKIGHECLIICVGALNGPNWNLHSCVVSGDSMSHVWCSIINFTWQKKKKLQYHIVFIKNENLREKRESTLLIIILYFKYMYFVRK